MSLLSKAVRIYVYMRIGLSNYIYFLIALFNSASLIWYFTGLKSRIPYTVFLALVFITFLPLAIVLGYYDLKKLVTKVSTEVNPYWKRANFFESKLFTGAIVWPIFAAVLREAIDDPEIKECLSKSAEETLKWISSNGEYVPRNPCFCELARKYGILDDEGYEKCLVGAVKAE